MNIEKDGLLSCSRKCLKDGSICEKEKCKHWIDYPKEFNCCLITIYENGPLGLREIAERMGISFGRVKQIETQALSKMKAKKDEIV